ADQPERIVAAVAFVGGEPADLIGDLRRAEPDPLVAVGGLSRACPLLRVVRVSALHGTDPYLEVVGEDDTVRRVGEPADAEAIAAEAEAVALGAGPEEQGDEVPRRQSRGSG